MTTTEADKLLNPDELRTICPIELRSCLETMRLIPLNDLVAPVVEAAEAHLTQLEAGGKGVDVEAVKRDTINEMLGNNRSTASCRKLINEVIDHLAAQGHLQPAKPEKLLTEKTVSNLSLIAPVAHFFEGDADKTALWFDTPNPMVGGVRPADMKPERLLKFIQEQMAANALAEQRREQPAPVEKDDIGALSLVKPLVWRVDEVHKCGHANSVVGTYMITHFPSHSDVFHYQVDTPRNINERPRFSSFDEAKKYAENHYEETIKAALQEVE